MAVGADQPRGREVSLGPSQTVRVPPALFEESRHAGNIIFRSYVERAVRHSSPILT